MTITRTTVPTVLLVERQLLIGEALCAVLEPFPEIRTIGIVAAIPPSWDVELVPDVVLIDVDGRADDVRDTLRRCGTTFAGARICCLTSSMQEETLRRCLAGGAEGYVLKESTPVELIGALASVAAGNTFVDPRVAGNVLRRRNAGDRRRRSDPLLDREIEIVCLIAHGHSNRAIGERLALSEKAVKNHVSRIFSKLRINARTQAAAYAFRNGMV